MINLEIREIYVTVAVPKFPRVLLSYNTQAWYIAPPILSPNQVTVGPARSNGGDNSSDFTIDTPQGHYDLHKLLKDRHIDLSFDLVVVVTDAGSQNFPGNLDSFNAVKVLCVADTHHGHAPIQRIVRYVLMQKFDYTAILYARHHMHWFVESGVGRVAWFPGLLGPLTPLPFRGERVPRISFVGQYANFHPRRKRLIDMMVASGVPFAGGQMVRDRALSFYSDSLASFNCSLNGDLNLRVFESLAAGACLLTDRLCPGSGMDLLLREGEDYVAFETEDDLARKSAIILKNYDATLSIARRGWDRFVCELSGSQRIKALMRWVSGGLIEDKFKPDITGFHGVDRRSKKSRVVVPLPARMKLYEFMQDKSKQLERIRVGIDSRLMASLKAEFQDLPRIEAREFRAEGFPREGGFGGKHHFDVVVGVANEALPAGVSAGFLVTVPVVSVG